VPFLLWPQVLEKKKELNLSLLSLPVRFILAGLCGQFLCKHLNRSRRRVRVTDCIRFSGCDLNDEKKKKR
jgi:hypothetical protein